MTSMFTKLGNVVVDSLQHKFHETHVETNDDSEDILLHSTE